MTWWWPAHEAIFRKGISVVIFILVFAASAVLVGRFYSVTNTCMLHWSSYMSCMSINSYSNVTKRQKRVWVVLWRRMSVEHWWNDCDGGRTKPCSKRLLQCHLIHQKSHLDWPRGERLWLVSRHGLSRKYAFLRGWRGPVPFLIRVFCVRCLIGVKAVVFSRRYLSYLWRRRYSYINGKGCELDCVAYY